MKKMNEEYMSKQQVLDLIEDTKETNAVLSVTAALR